MKPRDYEMKEFQFADLNDVLTKCGAMVVRGIMACVAMGVKPDGSPQKQNAASTIKAKGHNHPVVEKRARFAAQKTYSVEPMDGMSVMISVKNPVDSEIGANLHRKGYEFFGVTEAAEKAADRMMEQYIDEEVRRAAGAKR